MCLNISYWWEWDKDIHCFKEQEPCYASLELLTQQIKRVSKPQENPFVPDNNEIADPDSNGGEWRLEG